jgi:hypothetical protein
MGTNRSVSAVGDHGVAGPGGGDLSGGPSGRLVVVAEGVSNDRGGHFQDVVSYSDLAQMCVS